MSGVIWGIHAGKTGDAQSLFLTRSCIAVGWADIGNLSNAVASREAFKARYADAFPGRTSSQVTVAASQLFRFAHEMKVGDLVVFPAKVDRTVHIGRITGPYTYDTAGAPGYPHRRSVEWRKTVPRTQFSQGALYEIGSALSSFQVKSYADEFRLALEGKDLPGAVVEDETVQHVADEIEQNTRDFILKRLARDLKGHPFEDFVAHLLQAMGFRTRISPEGADGGVDIIAHRDALGFEPPIIKVQVKSQDAGVVSDGTVKQLKGALSGSEHGLLVTLGRFSGPARAFARTVPHLRLIDGQNLVDLILENYEKFDSRYKGLIPLKRVFVPEPLPTVDDN